jgi:hypothetical protein
MSKYGLGSEMSIQVNARLIAKGSDAPVSGGRYLVRLYDKDFFDDDFLGEATPDAEGRVRVTFDPSRFDRNDPIREKALDFYFVLYRDGEPIHRSRVMEDVQIDAIDTFRMGEGEIIDIGTFLVDA